MSYNLGDKFKLPGPEGSSSIYTITSIKNRTTARGPTNEQLYTLKSSAGHTDEVSESTLKSSYEKISGGRRTRRRKSRKSRQSKRRR